MSRNTHVTLRLRYSRPLKPRTSRLSWVFGAFYLEPLPTLDHEPNDSTNRADAQESYDSEKAALQPILTSEYAPFVHALTTGSESLYRGVSAGELLPRINDTKTTFGKLVPRIGTVDSWNKFQDGAADLILKSGIPTFLYVILARHSNAGFC